MRKVLLIALFSTITLLAGHFLWLENVQGQIPRSLTAGIGTPAVDGVDDPGEWTSDSITTSRGVTIKAMMDDLNFYIQASWPDATMSVNQNRWTWDGQQWNASEDEDRIAFIWEMKDVQGNSLNGSDGPSCQTMCHPGQGMATNFGRVDVWHAKATRFLPIGYTDDKYWDTDGPDGRHSDSGGGSGDTNRNDEQTGPEFRAASGPGASVTFLVEDQETLDSFNMFGTQLGTADLKAPIDPGDQFTAGDTVPGRILKNPTGNRASVRTVGRWADGVWTLEFSRKLSGETGDDEMPQDFAAVPGGSVRFVTDIFDNLLEHENHSFSQAGTSGGADFNVYTLIFPQPTTFYFAQTGNGDGFTAEHVFTNPSNDRIASASMNLFDDDGNPLLIDVAATPGTERFRLSPAIRPAGALSQFEFMVAPLGSVTIATSGVGEGVAVGAAEVDSDNALGGVVRFRIPGIGVAGVGESESLAAFIIPVRRIVGGINTGVALHHTKPSDTAPVLNLTLRNQDGEIAATRTIEDFALRGHLANFIDELFPDFFTPENLDDFSGTLVVEVKGGEVAATALELGSNPGEFTTLPVTPIG